MRKQARHQLILETVATAAVRSQGELVSLLNRAGYDVTQASVSRDLEELRIIKANGKYVLPVTQSGSNPLSISELLPAGENLIVAKCRAGLASAVTVRIDSEQINEIVGTIAGDDTIFIAVPNARAQQHVMRRLWELFDTNEQGE